MKLRRLSNAKATSVDCLSGQKTHVDAQAGVGTRQGKSRRSEECQRMDQCLDAGSHRLRSVSIIAFGRLTHHRLPARRFIEITSHFKRFVTCSLTKGEPVAAAGQSVLVRGPGAAGCCARDRVPAWHDGVANRHADGRPRGERRKGRTGPGAREEGRFRQAEAGG